MQVFKPIEQDHVALVGWGGSVLLATTEGDAGPTARRLAAMGVHLTLQAGLYDALADLLDDPREADMLVVDCDSFGGFDIGRRAFAILAEAGLRIPVILVSRDCAEQRFSPGRDEPTALRAPVSAVAMRVAFETAFHGRRRTVIP